MFLLMAVLLGAAPAPHAFQPLWPAGAPGQSGATDADVPAMAPYLLPPGRGPTAAIVVCPGGGYATLAMGHEGADVARWLNERGIAAFVLRYRLGHKYRHPVQLGDVQRALRLVRANAGAWRIDPARVGVWGFSAGGHLASMAATLFEPPDARAADPVDRQSARPDFAILAYPVIHLDGPLAHQGSRRRLLGEDASAALAASLSTSTRVTAQTPPTFLFHTAEDAGVPPDNSLAFFAALRRAGVPAELHIYERGRHGVGLAPGDPVLRSWGDRLTDWLRIRGVGVTPP